MPKQAAGREAAQVRPSIGWNWNASYARCVRHLVNALAEFESLGIPFLSLSDNLDLSTASGRLMFNIIGARAEFERELIRERVKAGMKNASAKGTRIGSWTLRRLLFYALPGRLCARLQ